jgi:hypothetical protein
MKRGSPMKKIVALVLAVALLVGFAVSQDKATKPEDQKSEKKACCDMARGGKDCSMKQADMKGKDCCMKSASAKAGDCCKGMKAKASKEKATKSM